MSKSSSNSVKDSDECLVESNPAKRTPHRHILRRHFSADVLGVGASGPGAKFPGNGPRNRLQKTGSRIFRELSPSHLLVSRMSDGNLLKNPDKDKESDVDLMASGLSFRAISELIKSNNLQGLKLFLDSRHANIEDRDEEGRTVLILAASLGKLDFIPLLLSHGADIHAEDNDKATALHAAAREGHADVCLELLENGAKIEACDSGQWTPLLWACYRGHVAAADCLISRGANINARGMYQVSSLLWAAGRGYYEIVQLLIDNNVKVDIGDKYGTTALIWACRRGHVETVELLLRAGASVDAVGMYSWTPLLVATRGNFVSVVEKLLEKSPNINTVDKDGMTALFIACKEGFQDIAFMLLNAGAYTNLQDRSGDTNLIYACKGGHKSIVEALIKKYADVDIKGKDNKTCLHWAIDKNHTAIVRLLLTANPDLEAKMVDGDTPLLRAVRQRNAAVVEMLLEKKAKISAADSKGDTALHIAMRARSKGIVEILLRNPKHSQLLYRPNRQGETPYNMDASSQKTIMGQIFGARRLNANEDGENILGYDLYSSALADILTEPALTMPITVGLYAKWGSGKSFLLGKLKDEMLSFTREWIVEPAFKNSVLLFLVVLHLATIIGLIGWIIPYSVFDLWINSFYIGLGVFAFIFVISYLFLLVLWKGTLYFDWYSLYNLKMFLATRFHSLKLVLDVIFSHPPGQDVLTGNDESMLNQRAQPLRLLFTDQTKVITSAGGQNSVTAMLGSLFDAVEKQYGLFATRLFRAFRPTPLSPTSRIAWRRLCCIPYVMIYLTCFVCLTACTVLIAITVQFNNSKLDGDVIPVTTTTTTPTPIPANSTGLTHYIEKNERQDSSSSLEDIGADFVLGLLLTLSVVVGMALVANLYTIGNCIVSLAFSQRRHLQRAVAKLDVVKSEGYLQALKNEVLLMVDMVTCLDAFTGQRTRLVVIVDGLDSCEQSKVLSILDAVHMLFSDEGSPFIILLAIDPHVITKAIELNINQAYRDTSISGDAYLRNLVHMPFFLQNVSLRRVAVAQQACGGGFGFNKKSSTLWLETDDRRMSTESSAAWKKGGGGKHSKSFFRRTRNDSIGSSIGSRLNHAGTSGGGGGGPADLTSVSLTDDYFSDVNVKSVRRLMNVIYVMGRLMKAFNIDFSWYHLAVWVNLSEQWPYRLSWLIFFFDMNEEVLEDSTPLKELYDRVRGVMPTQKDLEPLLEMDRDEKKLEALLSLKKKMTVKDIKTFLPFSINLDPYIKKVIKDEYQIHEEVVNHGITAPLTQRQAAGLSRKLSNDPQAKNPQLVGMPQTPVAPTFHSYGMPHMPPWQAFQPPTAFGYDSRGTTPPDHSEIELDPELTLKPLSRKTVDEVCQVVQSVDGLSRNRIESYCEAVMTQNISGAVLSHCKIDELKSVLNMNFGDWELFQLVVYALRDRERKMKIERKTLSLQPPSLLPSLSRRSPHPTGSPDRKRRVGIINESVASNSQHQEQPHSSQQSYGSTSNLSNPPLPKVKSTLESQVTFEDAMISGLLSTLNEEAQEDVFAEEMSNSDIARGSSENISYNASLENLHKSIEAISPTPSGIHRNSARGDIEMGNASGGSKSHSIVAAAIGGGGGNTLGWDFGSSGDLVSVPTSPTLSQSPIIPMQSSRTRQDSEKSVYRKARHLRDRLDSLSEDEYGNKNPAGMGRNMSRSFGIPGSGGGDLPVDNNHDEDEPYAWISQTAPASPRGSRSRAGSIIPNEDETFSYGASDLTSLARRESTAFSLKRRGTATTYNSKESVYGLADATSMEKLSDKVKKKIRHALLAMDSPGKSGMPAFQRAKPSGGSMRAHFYVSDANESSGSSIGKGARPKGTLVHSNSVQVADSPRGHVDDVDFREVEEDESCSSPEQETVAKRPESGFRGPPVHQLFNAIAAVNIKEEEFLMSPEAVSPSLTARTTPSNNGKDKQV